MKFNLVLVFLIVVFIGCIEGVKVVPMKYSRDGEDLICDAIYNKSSLNRIICYNTKRDTILIDTYADGKRNVESIRWYSPGKIMEAGRFKNDEKIGIWRGYYESGQIRYFNFYNEKIDSIPLFYQKRYNSSGELTNLIFPLRYRTNVDSMYKVGKSYQLFVDLLYSEYDSVQIMGLMNLDGDKSTYEDTIWYAGNSLYYEFSPKCEGINTVEGMIWELDGAKQNIDEAWGGEKYFKFQYEATN